MHRRDALRILAALAAASLAWPACAEGRTGKPYRLISVADMTQEMRGMFIQVMRELDWEEGRDFVLQASGIPPYGAVSEEAARKLVEAKPDLFITWVSAWQIQRFTSTIPIVMMTSGHPVEVGVAKSLARPGKNATGNTIWAGTGFFAKLVELLRDAKPGIKRIAVLVDFDNTRAPPPPDAGIDKLTYDKALVVMAARAFFPIASELRRAKHALRLEMAFVTVGSHTAEEVLKALEATRPDALLFVSKSVWAMRHSIMEFALKWQLPSIDVFRWPTSPNQEHQPLLFYSTDFPNVMRTAAPYMLRILDDGADPAELPIQRPTKFNLTVNMKTARNIDLTVPPSLLLRADEIIE